MARRLNSFESVSEVKLTGWTLIRFRRILACSADWMPANSW